MGYMRSSGLRVVTVPNAGYARVPAKRLRLILLPRVRRGMGATGSDVNSCTPPNSWNQFKGVCCAPPGTPAAGDPCSILNDPGYLASQAADVGPIGPNGVPLSSPSFADYPGSPTRLADIAQYPNNVQQDVQVCYTNPGASFVDSVGMRVNCPAQKTQIAPGGPGNNGIWVSSFPYSQLASMLAPSITATANLVGNAPFALAPSNPGEGIAKTPAAGAPAVSVKLVNGSGGSSSSFNVGDSWQVIVTGPPNSAVSASASQNGTSLGTSPMGTIAANGQLVLQGTFAASQVGQWTETWTVAGKNAGSVSFSVAAPGSSGGGAGGSGGSGGGGNGSGGGGSQNSSSTSNPFGFLTNTFNIGSVAIPIWAGLGVGLVGLFMLGKGR